MLDATKGRLGNMNGRLAATPTSRMARRRATPARTVALLLAFLLPLAAAACVTVSRQDEISMGRDYREQLNEELPLIREEAILGPVSETGLELAHASPRPDMPYAFHVVNTDAINAFAVPGGFVYMNRGLLEASDDMAEVAGVLAHEVGHIVGRHSARQIERMRRAQLGLVGASVLFGQPEGLAALGVNVAANLYFARYSREQEAEADSLAVHMLVDTGWDPRGLTDFFGKLLEERERRPGALEALFTSHPLTEDRIASVNRLIDRLPAERRRGLRTSLPAYDAMRRALEAHPPPPEEFRTREEGTQG